MRCLFNIHFSIENCLKLVKNILRNKNWMLLTKPTTISDFMEDLVKKMNHIFEVDGRPYFAHNIESIVHFETFSPLALDLSDLNNIEIMLKRNEGVNRIATALLAQGIITKYGNRGFTCMLIEAFENVLQMIPK